MKSLTNEIKVSDEEKIALMISREVAKCPLLCARVYHAIGDWYVEGQFVINEGQFNVEFLIDPCDKYLGFSEGNCFQCDFEFKKDKRMGLNHLQAFSSKLPDRLKPLLEYLEDLSKRYKD